MKNYLITLIDKEGNQKKIGCQSENINTDVGYATSQMQMPFTIVSVEELESKDKLTEIERIILENTYKGYEYIARDIYGDLMLFIDKPIKRTEDWYNYGWHEFMAFNHLFQNIKWEDNEPYKFR